MIRIAVDFRVSRARGAGAAGEGAPVGKPGEVVLRLSGLSDAGGWAKRCVNAGVRAASREEAHGALRGEVAKRIATVARIVEELAVGGGNGTGGRKTAKGAGATVERVADLARRALKGFAHERRQQESGAAATGRTMDGKPILRGDLVRVAPPFCECFVFAVPDVPAQAPDLTAYAAEMARLRRGAGRVSSAKNFASLARELRRWRSETATGKRSKKGEEAAIGWDEVTKGMVEAFASWLAGRGLKGSTQAFYLRQLRTLLFAAARQGLCEAESGWFAAAGATEGATTCDKPGKPGSSS